MSWIFSYLKKYIYLQNPGNFNLKYAIFHSFCCKDEDARTRRGSEDSASRTEEDRETWLQKQQRSDDDVVYHVAIEWNGHWSWIDWKENFETKLEPFFFVEKFNIFLDVFVDIIQRATLSALLTPNPLPTPLLCVRLCPWSTLSVCPYIVP